MKAFVKATVLLPILFAASAPAAGGMPTSCQTGPFIVFFDWGAATLGDDAQSILRNTVAAADSCGPADAMIAGHTDTSEPAGLAKARAVAVQDVMAHGGIARTRMTITSFAAEKPRVPTDRNVREFQNRRVEITFGPPGSIVR